MRRLYTLLFYSVVTISCIAQTQQGYVKTLGRPNQKGVALSDVTIRVKGVHNTVLSKADGTFSLQIQADPYSLQQVQKTGYVLNDQGIIGRKHAYAANVTLPIVMVSIEQLQTDKLRIENNAYKVAEKNYKAKLELLEKQKEENTIAIEEYRQQIHDLQDKFEKYQSLIDGLADHYAHVDYDDLDEKEREINLCIENGELEKAESLLNQLGIQQRIANIEQQLASGQRLMNEANADMAAVMKQQEKDAEYLYQLYTIALSRFDNEKAQFYIETRAALDTTNVEWQTKAGEFANEYLADYPEARYYFQSALNQSICQYGEENESVGDALNNIGMTYANQGDFSKAREYFTKALSLEEVIGRDNVCVSDAYNNIGVLHFYNAEYDNAAEFLSIGLAIREKILGSNNTNVASSYNNLGAVFDNQGKYSDALVYYFKALDIQVELFGENHPSVALSYNNIGNVYDQQGDISKALEYYSKSLVIREKTFSRNHPQIAVSFLNIGGIYDMMEEYDKALEYEFNALAIFEKNYNNDNTYIATALGNIGNTYGHQGNFAKALEFCFKALDIMLLIYGMEHPNIAVLYNNIGSIYQKEGRLSEALDYCNRALPILENNIGYEHPYTKGLIERINQIKKEMSSPDY